LVTLGRLRPTTTSLSRSTPHAPRSLGSTVGATRRTGYPWPEQMDRKMSRNVEKRGVHAARNGPSEDTKCWQRVELGIHGLKSWGRNWSRKVRETRSSSSQQRPERSAEGPPPLWHQHQLLQDPVSPALDGRLVVKRKKPVQGRSLYTKGRRRRWLHRKPFRPFGYGLLNEAGGRHTVCFNTKVGRAGKRGGLGKRLVTRSKSKARPTRARRVTVIFPPRSGFVQVDILKFFQPSMPPLDLGIFSS